MPQSSPAKQPASSGCPVSCEYPFATDYTAWSEYPNSFDFLDRFEASDSSVANSQMPCELGPEQKRKAFLQFASRPNPWWKRIVDIIVSLALAILLAPLLIGIAIFIRVVSGGPVFFRQKRLGEMGEDFEILKFRTMIPSLTATEDHRRFVSSLNADNQQVRKPDLSARLIPGGRFLRSWSLDELPQLFNVLRGEMSIIGPRPDVLAWNDYEEWQLQRFACLPGITGLWQVSGKNRLTFEQMIELDIEYVNNRSLGLDLWILVKTFRVLIRRDNG